MLGSITGRFPGNHLDGEFSDSEMIDKLQRCDLRVTPPDNNVDVISGRQHAYSVSNLLIHASAAFKCHTPASTLAFSNNREILQRFVWNLQRISLQGDR